MQVEFKIIHRKIRIFHAAAERGQRLLREIARAAAMRRDRGSPVMKGLSVSYRFTFFGSDRWKNCAMPTIAITKTTHSSTNRHLPITFHAFTVILLTVGFCIRNIIAYQPQLSRKMFLHSI